MSEPKRQILIIGDDIDRDQLHAAIQMILARETQVMHENMGITLPEYIDTHRIDIRKEIARLAELGLFDPTPGPHHLAMLDKVEEFKAEVHQPKQKSEFIEAKMRWKRERWQR
jgi:hypothetical protein